MPEQSPTQLINDWATNAEKATQQNAKAIATAIANLYANNAVLCATEGIITEQSNILADYQGYFENGWVLTGITPNQPSINQISQNWAWAVGQWKGSALSNPQDPNSRFPLAGCWSILFNNQPPSNNPNQANWLIQEHTIVTNPPSQTQ